MMMTAVVGVTLGSTEWYRTAWLTFESLEDEIFPSKESERENFEPVSSES